MSEMESKNVVNGDGFFVDFEEKSVTQNNKIRWVLGGTKEVPEDCVGRGHKGGGIVLSTQPM